MRPHANDFDRALKLLTVNGDGGGIDGIDEAVLQRDAPRVESFKTADKTLEGWRRCKRIGAHDPDELLGFFLQPSRLELFASLAACLVKTTRHMLTTPGRSRRRTPRRGYRGRR